MSEVNLNFSLNVAGGYNNETNFLHNLLVLVNWYTSFDAS